MYELKAFSVTDSTERELCDLAVKFDLESLCTIEQKVGNHYLLKAVDTNNDLRVELEFLASPLFDISLTPYAYKLNQILLLGAVGMYVFISIKLTPNN